MFYPSMIFFYEIVASFQKLLIRSNKGAITQSKCCGLPPFSNLVNSKFSISGWRCSRSPSYGVYISQLIRFARVCSNVDDFDNRNLFLTAKLLKQGYYRYNIIRKAFSKFYHRHSELIVKYSIGLETLLQQGISEPIFYGDLVHKFKRIVGKPFSDQVKKIIKRYIKVGYNLDVMRQFACRALNPITVYSYGFLFNCTTVGQASDFMTALA